MRSRILLLIVAGATALSLSILFVTNGKKYSPPPPVASLPPAEVNAQSVAPKEITYEVKKGDTLWSIARKFGITVEEISQLNRINFNKTLQIGEKLRIPIESQVSQQQISQPKKQNLSQNEPRKGAVYQVRKGDTLWTIAEKFGVEVDDIAKANGISLNKTLQIGEKLLIPSSSAKKISQTTSSTQRFQSGVLYQVRKGDSLWTIARKYGISVEKLARANDININKTLQIGDKILIPGVKEISSPKRPTLKVCREGAYFRKGPGTNHPPIAKLPKGTILFSLGQKGDWQKVALPNGKVGWVRRDMLGLSLAKKQATNVARKPHTSAHSKAAQIASAKEGSTQGSHSVVNTALRYQGTRYSYGGLSSRGFDCSGFVKYVYQKYGLNLPHNAAAQYRYGKPVSKSELQPGDLVFFRTGRSRGINHVGIYIGNGKFVHASSAKGRVRIDSLNSGYYNQRFVGARRLK